METVILGILALAAMLAVGARVRLWYYERRGHRYCREERLAEAARDGLRHQGDRIWWEGQR